MTANVSRASWAGAARRAVWTLLRTGGSLVWTGIRFVAGAFGLLLALLVSLSPVAMLSSWDPAGWTLIPYYVVMATLAGAGVALLVLPSGRAWMTKPANVGVDFPYWFATWVAVSLILLAIDLFATITWEVFADDAVLVSTGGGPLTQERLMDFYLWHALEFVPFLKVGETLDWQAPAVYSGAGVGWLLLTFKGVIVVPIVLAFRSFSRTRKMHRSDQEERAAASPRGGHDESR